MGRPRPFKHTPEQAETFWAEVSHRFRWLKASKKMTYCGVPIRKNPLDLWTYQDIIWKLKPALIVEFGTWQGGSALWLAHQLDRNGKGNVMTVDVAPPDNPPIHDRITYLHGSSLDYAVYNAIVARADLLSHYTNAGPVLFIEDSRHTQEHVRAELEMYHHYVSPGSYFIVEDAKAGVRRAVQRFVAKHHSFKIERRKEGFRITSATMGFLRKRKPKEVPKEG